MNFTTAISCAALVAAPNLNLSAAETAKLKSPLEGTWKWTYRTADGAEVPSRVKFAMKNNELIATTFFRQGSEATAENLKFNGSQISFKVVRERDGGKVVTQYAGELKGDVLTGKINSKFDGVEQTIDWEAKRPSGIEGAWKWSAPGPGPGRPVEWTMTLEPVGGNLSGAIKPGGGAGPGRGAPAAEIRIHRAVFADGKLYFETERVSQSADGGVRTNRFRGKLSGDKIVGQSELNSGGKYATNRWEPTRVE